MFKSQNIKGLLFDLGGVVINIDFECALQSWSQWTAITIDEMRSRFQIDGAYRKHERGELDAKQYFAHLRQVLELDANDTEIASGWNAIILNEIEETVDQILKIKCDLPCFVFSNTNPTHQAFWMSAFPDVMASFEQIFVSSELGLRKPEPQAFKAVAHLTGIDLDKMLFFDDTLENILAAQAIGMPSIHVRSHLDVNQAISEIVTT